MNPGAVKWSSAPWAVKRAPVSMSLGDSAPNVVGLMVNDVARAVQSI
jgi:hypothetical protein